MIKNRTINIAEPFFSPEDKTLIHKELDAILDTKLSMGKHVKEFENEFSKKVGTKYAIAMNSCTSALEAALTYYNIQGKEVIVPTQTFIATGMAVHLSGGKPIYSEIKENDLCLDIEDIKKKTTKNTVGIIIVHMAGYISSDIDKIRDYCDKNNLFLIEDAAHTPGAEVNNVKSGNFGHIGCFSFYPTKILTSGEGGMLTTNSQDIANYARSFQNRGRDMMSKVEKYILPSRNVRMTEFSALIGRVQLSHLEKYLLNRRKVAKIYQKQLGKIKKIKLILPKKLDQTACWKIPVILDQSYDREEIIIKLKKNGIEADLAYNPPLHLQPVMKKLYNNQKGMLPRSENILSRHICLPSHQNMTEDDANYVCEKLLKILELK